MIFPSLAGIFVLVAAKRVEVPPIDNFDLPEKLYRYFPDPSRSIVDASLNEDVMEWQRYEIDFKTEPRIQAESEHVTSFKISGADKIEYECVLPGGEKVEDKAEAEWKAKKSKKSVRLWLEALRPLQKKTLVHKAGWWTYSFGYMGQIKQYHELSKEEKEQRPGIDRDEFLLGRFVPSSSTSKVDPTNTKLVQEYLDGDICVLPNGLQGDARTIQVNFKCDSSALLDYIQEVVEISTCKYIMTVGSPRVCKLAEASRVMNGVIQCYPVKPLLRADNRFSQSPSDSEHTGGLTEEDRKRHKKHQHNVIRHVASNSKSPQFSRLVNELITEFGDLFDEMTFIDTLEVPQVGAGDDEDDEDQAGEEEEEDSDEEKKLFKMLDE